MNGERNYKKKEEEEFICQRISPFQQRVKIKERKNWIKKFDLGGDLKKIVECEGDSDLNHSRGSLNNLKKHGKETEGNGDNTETEFRKTIRTKHSRITKKINK